MTPGVNPRRLCVAPMMDWTDRHFRMLVRQFSRKIWLYTEMITAAALVHTTTPDRLLNFHPAEHPIALQLGGYEPLAMAKAAEIALPYGYDEINLNVGCPSDRVQSGRFGACLMKEPQQVAECVAAIRRVVSVPVTVKTRIGIDHFDDYDFLCRFIDTVSQAGCGLFVIHARKAWLTGVNPKQNRTIPPLNYERVYQLRRDFPDLEFILNGGVLSLDAVQQHLQHVDGVMVGRAIYERPAMFLQTDPCLYGVPAPVQTELEAFLNHIDYVRGAVAEGVPLKAMTRHWMGLFNGLPGARLWRGMLSQAGRQQNPMRYLDDLASKVVDQFSAVAI